MYIKYDQKNLKQIETLTGIYKKAIRAFLFKHHPEYREKIFKEEWLHSDRHISVEVQETLRRLESLAFMGLDERRLIFELEEVKGMENCGLLYRMANPYDEPQFCFIRRSKNFWLSKKLPR